MDPQLLNTLTVVAVLCAIAGVVLLTLSLVRGIATIGLAMGLLFCAVVTSWPAFGGAYTPTAWLVFGALVVALALGGAVLRPRASWGEVGGFVALGSLGAAAVSWLA